MMPRADSLIVYEEVLESTPEDPNSQEETANVPPVSSTPNTKEEAKNEVLEASTSSAEPLVADERVPVNEAFNADSNDE